VLKEALEPGDLTNDLVREVERAGAQAPPGLAVSVKFVREPGRGWTEGARFHVTVSQTEAHEHEEEAAAPPPPPQVRAPAIALRVVDGDARPKTLASEAVRINIGRQVEVIDQSGRPVRHNDIAFVGDDEVSRSVSRAHAHITFDRTTSTHRVFDENSAHGTQIERAGRRITVPAGRDGLKLRPGDEIHVGRAVVRFEVKSK
jgi:hypothetical protein